MRDGQLEDAFATTLIPRNEVFESEMIVSNILDNEIIREKLMINSVKG